MQDLKLSRWITKTRKYNFALSAH